MTYWIGLTANRQPKRVRNRDTRLDKDGSGGHCPSEKVLRFTIRSRLERTSKAYTGFNAQVYLRRS